MHNPITSIAGDPLHILGHSKSLGWRELIAVDYAQFVTGGDFFLRRRNSLWLFPGFI
jgi:hypothetical protein